MLRKPAQRRITINDIAKHAGVSKTAVSFAFNMPGRLSADTTLHILTIARELGYTPNPIARSLNTRRTNALGLIVPQNIPDVLNNPFYATLMSGIGQVCKAEGLSLMLVPPMRGSMLDATYAALIDGCIVNGLEPTDDVVHALVQRNMPFVMIDVNAAESIATITINDHEGALLAMSHLLALGHRHIAILSFESPTGTVKDYVGTLKYRFDGISTALHAYGLSLNSPGIYVQECACSVAGGFAAYAQIMAQSPKPTAIFALSDIIAYGVIKAAGIHGLQLPHDLSIVGFDDLETSMLVSPALTSIRQPILEKGRQAADILIRMIQGENSPAHVTLPVELVIRESTTRPPTGAAPRVVGDLSS